MNDILERIDKYINEADLKKLRGTVTCYFPSGGDGYYGFNEVPKKEIDFFKKAGLKVGVIKLPDDLDDNEDKQKQFIEYVDSLKSKGLKLKDSKKDIFPKHGRDYDWEELRSIIVVNGDVQKLANALEKLIDDGDDMWGFDENGLFSTEDIESFISYFKTSDQFLGNYPLFK